jgi:dTDP-4-dehydrorhamnose 3,5-epimerase
MQVRDIGLGVLEIVPKRLGDARGFFAETWQRQRFRENGIDEAWVQDNQSLSAEPHVLRGLHFQRAPMAQAKLIRVLRGAVFDVAVDIRPGSASFGRWVSCVLSAGAFNQLYVPVGFAHGFLTLETDTEVLYKVSAPYAPDCERAIAWDDPSVAIAWPLSEGQKPLLSAKDAEAPFLSAIMPDLVFQGSGT